MTQDENEVVETQDIESVSTPIKRTSGKKKKRKSSRRGGAKSSNSLPLDFMMVFFAAVIASALYALTMMLESLLAGYGFIEYFEHWSPYSYYQMMVCIWVGICVGGIMLCWRLKGLLVWLVPIPIIMIMVFSMMVISGMSRAETLRSYQGQGGNMGSILDWVAEDWTPRTEVTRADIFQLDSYVIGKSLGLSNRPLGTPQMFAGLHVTFFENWSMFFCGVLVIYGLYVFGKARWGWQTYVPMAGAWVAILLLSLTHLCFPYLVPMIFGMPQGETILVVNGEPWNWPTPSEPMPLMGKSFLEKLGFLLASMLHFSRFAYVFAFTFLVIFGIRYWLKQTPRQWHSDELQLGMKKEMKKVEREQQSHQAS